MAATNTNRDLPSNAERPVWVWDHDRRRVVWANELALRFWGERSLLELLDRDFPPDDLAAIQFAQLLDAALRSDVERVRARIVLTPSTKPVRIDAIASRFALGDGRSGLRVEAEPAPVGELAELERLRDILGRIPQAVALFAEDGTLLYQNAASDYAFGDADLAGLAQRYGDQREARDALRALLVNGAFSHSAMLQTRFGSREHRVSMRRMIDPVSGGFAALTLFNDTGERDDAVLRAAGKALVAEGAVLASIEAGAAVFDDALKPLYANDHARMLLGLGIDNANMPLASLFPRERTRLARALTDIRDGHSRSAQVELAVAGQEGRLRWVRLDIRRGGWDGAGAWLATVTDVTGERRAAIAAQRTVDARDVALARIGVGILALREDGYVADASPAAEQLLGAEPRSLRGEDIRGYLTDDSAAVLDRGLADDAEQPAFAIALRHAEGTARDLRLALAPAERLTRDYRIAAIRGEEGTSPDRSPSTETTQAVARTSHELRTPLNAILGFTQMMLANPQESGSGKHREYLADIDQSARYMARLIDDLLNLHRIENATLGLERKPVALTNMIRGIARQFDVAAKNREVDITLSLEDGLPAVFADSHTLRQAMTNLVANAVKYAASPGWVRISLVQRASGAIEFEVIDNGEGMTEEECERVLRPFEQASVPFETTDRGLGLGLPLAQGLAEANGARFSLKSEKGLGTIAQIVFPPKLIAKSE